MHEKYLSIPEAADEFSIPQTDIFDALRAEALHGCVSFINATPGRVVTEESPKYGQTLSLVGLYTLLMRAGGLNLLDSAESKFRHGIAALPHPGRFDVIWVERAGVTYAITKAEQGRKPDEFQIADELPAHALLAIRRDDFVRFARSRVAGVGSGAHAPPSDPQRRLAALRALGGDAVLSRSGELTVRGMGKLVAQEKAEQQPRRSEKTIRADLLKAAKAESAEKRESVSAFSQAKV